MQPCAAYAWTADNLCIDRSQWKGCPQSTTVNICIDCRCAGQKPCACCTQAWYLQPCTCPDASAFALSMRTQIEARQVCIPRVCMLEHACTCVCSHHQPHQHHPKHHETTPSTTKHKQHHPRIALSIKLVGMCTCGSHAPRPRGERQTNDGVLRWRCVIILLVRALLQSCGTDLVIPTAKVTQRLLRVSRSAAGTLSVG